MRATQVRRWIRREGGPALSEALPEDRRRPHPGRLAPDAPGYDEIMRAHDAAVAAGEPGYLDPRTGLYVMTAVNLWTRGSCCDSGCRHCPYVERRDGLSS